MSRNLNVKGGNALNRTQILNHLLTTSSKYLEIGVSNPAHNFNKIITFDKQGVDPGIEYEQNPVTYPMTSDEFFTKLRRSELDLSKNRKWDVIFIDGLHTAEQVERDVNNALRHIKRKGFIVLHDCNPPSEHHQTEQHNGGAWNGTVWKAWLKFREEYRSCTVNCDWGVGIMTTITEKHDLGITDNYHEFYQNRQKLLNLIEPNEFKYWIEKAY